MSSTRFYTFLIGMFLLMQGFAGHSVFAQHEDHDHSNHTGNVLMDEEEKAKQSFYYTCSMHPQIRESGPGRCPICNMALTKVEVDDEEDEPAAQVVKEKVWQCKDYPDVTSTREEPCPIDGSPMILKATGEDPASVIAKVKLRKAQMKHFNPSFFPVTTMKMAKKVRLLGSVLQTEDRESFIPARVEGRVEEVLVKSTGSFIKKGDAVLKLYSPKLITTGEEYIISRQSYNRTKKKDFKALLDEAKRRLILWGIKEYQIESWFERGKVPNKITIYSAETGIVSKRLATVGKYFKEGQNFFELYDLSEVWIEMDVYEHDAGIVKLGQNVSLEFTALPGEVVQGQIDFVNPVLDTRSRTLKVRATIPNKDGVLKPGMIADATVNVKLEGEPIVIPRTAVIDTGKRKVVWKQKKGRSYEAIVIRTGYESEGYVEVKKGLAEGDSVVIEGNFLLDAQAQLFGGYSDIPEGGGSVDPHSHHKH